MTRIAPALCTTGVAAVAAVLALGVATAGTAGAAPRSDVKPVATTKPAEPSKSVTPTKTPEPSKSVTPTKTPTSTTVTGRITARVELKERTTVTGYAWTVVGTAGSKSVRVSPTAKVTDLTGKGLTRPGLIGVGSSVTFTAPNGTALVTAVTVNRT